MVEVLRDACLGGLHVRKIAKRDGTDIPKCGESSFFLALALLLIGVVSCVLFRLTIPAAYSYKFPRSTTSFRSQQMAASSTST